MDHEHHTGGQVPSEPVQAEPGGARSAIVFAILLAIAAFFLLSEHREHVFGYWPYLLVLACPLLHLFHHGGHGGHAGHQHAKSEELTSLNTQQPPTQEA